MNIPINSSNRLDCEMTEDSVDLKDDWFGVAMPPGSTHHTSTWESLYQTKHWSLERCQFRVLLQSHFEPVLRISAAIGKFVLQVASSTSTQVLNDYGTACRHQE
eukprot:scaffold11725_cov116-Cylindrotheca_fusiformis.AAC.11